METENEKWKWKWNENCTILIPKGISYWRLEKHLKNNWNKEQINCIVFAYEQVANVELSTEE